MKCFYNDVDWVIAEDESDAWDIWCEVLGEEQEDYEHMLWEDLPLTNILTMYDEQKDNILIVKSVAEFIEESGRGFLMSTEF